EQTHGVRAADLPRSRFVELCLAETRRVAAGYEELWRRLGLSVDWSLRYSTIEPRCRQVAQAAFIRLYRAGHVRRAEDPIQWCPECRTALAQADVEDHTRTGTLYRIAFTAPGGAGGERLEIATTRPELLPACVALYCHPDDDRWRGRIGGTARVPLTGHEVPVRADTDVDPAYGTGLMMVCTFGDGADVVRWRRDGLPLRLMVTADGRLAAAGRRVRRPAAAGRPRGVRVPVGGARGTGGQAAAAPDRRGARAVRHPGRVPGAATVVHRDPGARRGAAAPGGGAGVGPAAHAAAAGGLDRRPALGLERQPAAALRHPVPGLVLPRLRHAGPGRHRR